MPLGIRYLSRNCLLLFFPLFLLLLFVRVRVSFFAIKLFMKIAIFGSGFSPFYLMSTSEQSTFPVNSGRSRKRSLSPDLNMDHISSGSTFSQNIESIEGLTSLHADQQVFIVSFFFCNFLNIEAFSVAYMELRHIFRFTEQNNHLF